MTSTITLYKDCKIIPTKNFIVDDLESYLSSLTSATRSNFQYLRNDLKLTIKINEGEEFSESLYANNYNYLKVSQNGVNYYYFITKKTQIAESTIALELVMDTLNTYKWGEDFAISNRTRVKREHKDRLDYRVKRAFIPISLFTTSPSYPAALINRTITGGIKILDGETHEELTFPATFRLITAGVISLRGFSIIDCSKELSTLFHTSTPSRYFLSSISIELIPYTLSTPVSFNDIQFTGQLIRVVDYYSEGITPVLYKEELGELNELCPNKWNLVYRNADNDQDAVSCYCIPEDEMGLIIPAKTNFVYTDFEDGKYYIIGAFWKDWTWRQTASGSIEFVLPDSRVVRVSHSVDAPGSVATFESIIIHRSGSTLQYAKYIFTANLDLISGGVPLITNRVVAIPFTTFTTMKLGENKLSAKVNSIPGVNDGYTYWNYEFETTEQEYVLTNFADVNRVDPKLIKIIKLPYFPSTYEYANDLLKVDSTWVYETSVYKSLLLNDLDTKFSNTITSDILNPLNIFEVSGAPNTTALRDDKYESKLFHSDYYQPKFVYDSFGFIFEIEKIDYERFNPSTYFTFEFIMTSTINSKFMFKFPEYVLRLSTQDYDNILPVARNNEAPIYNSSYITYLRTAYRYDLKNYYQKEGMIKFTGLTGMVDSAKSMLSDFAEEDYGGGLFDFYSSNIKRLANAIVQRNTNEWSLQAKIEQLKNQANSVNGSDDIDLMENYANNKAKLCLYKVSERMRGLLADLFYYFGYTTDEIKIPQVNTRYWFNFLSCELEFTGLDKNISDSAKNDLVARFNAGATFLHHHEVWDFEQVKENWETILLN